MNYDFNLVIHLFDLTGIAAFAATGALVASRNGLDIFGALVLGFITGIGGGTLRDVLLDTPIFWLDEMDALWACLAGVSLVFLTLKAYGSAPRATINFLDAIGLAVFTVIGANKALDLDYHGVVAVITGFLTGCGGGMLRDVLANEIPLVLAHKRLYATPSIVGGTAFVLIKTNMHESLVLAVSVGIALTLIIRFGSLFYNWRLPLFPQQPAK